MKSGNPLAAAIVIALSTALVVFYAFLRPEQTLAIIIIYLATIVFLSFIVYFISKMYGKLKTSIDAEDFAEITESLNTEIIVWCDDFSFVAMNSRIRELLGITGKKYDEKEMLKKAFELPDLTDESFKTITETGSHEAHFLTNEDKLITIAWSTSVIKKRKKNCVYLSTGFNLTEIKNMQVNLDNANDFFNTAMDLAEIGVIMTTDRKKFIVSSIAMEALGLTTSSIDIGTLRTQIHPNDRIQFDRAVKSGESYNSEVQNVELRIKSLNGSAYRWYSFRYKSIQSLSLIHI